MSNQIEFLLSKNMDASKARLKLIEKEVEKLSDEFLLDEKFCLFMGDYDYRTFTYVSKNTVSFNCVFCEKLFEKRFLNLFSPSFNDQLDVSISFDEKLDFENCRKLRHYMVTVRKRFILNNL